MSGVKKTPLEICQDDVRNLRSDLANSRQQAQNAVRQAVDQSERQHRQQLQGIQRDAEQRENRLQGQIGNLNNEITRNWQQHRQAMNQQRQEFQQDLQQQSTVFHQELRSSQEAYDYQLKVQSMAFQQDLRGAEERNAQKMQETENRLQRNINDAEARNDKKILETEARLHKDIRNVEANMNRKVTDLRQDMKSMEVNINKNINTLAKNTEKALHAQNEKFDRVTQQQQTQISQARQDINAILSREQNADKKATMLSEALNTMIAAFEKDEWFKKFRARELATLKNKVQQIQQSGNSGYSNVALFQTQLFDLQTLEADVEREARQFEALHSVVSAAARNLLSTMLANRANTHFIAADGEKGAKVEVDFWTYGAFSKLQAEVEAIQQRLQQDKLKATLNETALRQDLDRLAAMDVEQSNLMNLAIQRGNTSHIRAEMADMIIETLEKQAYQVIRDADGKPARNFMGSEHQAQDQRAGYYVILRNSTGNEISVVIQPDDNLVKNELIVNTKNKFFFDDRAACQRVEELNQSLRAEGLEVGNMNAPQRGHLEELYDVNALKNRGLSPQTKQKLRL